MDTSTIRLREKIYTYLFETEVISGSKIKLIFTALLRFLSKKCPKERALFDKFLKSNSDQEMIIRNAIGTFLVLPTDDSVGKAMPYFEKRCHEWLKNDRKKLFIDVGASIGFYTILAAGRYGYGAVVSFEPNPKIYQVLEENVALNNLQHRVKCINAALGEKREILPFRRYLWHTGRSGFTGNDVISGIGAEEHEVIHIETSVFDDVMEEQNIETRDIALIKIDVEGFEYSVLKGMVRTLRQVNDVSLFVEVSGKFKEQTMNLLGELGFILQERIGINHLFIKGTPCLETSAISAYKENLNSAALPAAT